MEMEKNRSLLWLINIIKLSHTTQSKLHFSAILLKILLTLFKKLDEDSPKIDMKLQNTLSSQRNPVDIEN